jgi:hypothetical protein
VLAEDKHEAISNREGNGLKDGVGNISHTQLFGDFH